MPSPRTCRSRGVVGPPVTKTTVVATAVSPGPSPVAKTAVVGAAVSPGPSPVAKAAVVGAASHRPPPLLIAPDASRGAAFRTRPSAGGPGAWTR